MTQVAEGKFYVEVHDETNAEHFAQTIEEAWTWINENVPRGVYYVIYEDDKKIEEAYGV